MITVSKIFLELLLVLIGVMVAITTAVFSFTTYQHLLEVSRLKLDVSKIIQKLQQNIDNIKVEQGLIKCNVRDIRGAIERSDVICFHDRENFPEENIPPHAEWDVEEQ